MDIYLKSVSIRYSEETGVYDLVYMDQNGEQVVIIHDIKKHERDR